MLEFHSDTFERLSLESKLRTRRHIEEQVVNEMVNIPQSEKTWAYVWSLRAARSLVDALSLKYKTNERFNPIESYHGKLQFTHAVILEDVQGAEEDIVATVMAAIDGNPEFEQPRRWKGCNDEEYGTLISAFKTQREKQIRLRLKRILQ